MNLAPSTPSRPYAALASRLFAALLAACTLICLATLVLLLWNIVAYGWERVSFDFINRYPSGSAEKAGIKSSLVGSVYLIFLTALFSVPIGVGAPSYLREF